MVEPTSHIELSLACLRPERLEEQRPFADRLLAALGDDARTVDPVWAERVSAEVARHPADRLLYSCENLSWIRYPDELARLAALFPGARITAVMFVRDPDDFLASYQAMSRFVRGDGSDPGSIWHFGPSTWLVDYQERIDLWRGALGERFHVFEYERCVAADGSTIPTLLDVLGIDRSLLDDPGRYFLNQRP
jgi:hypothetical protein